MPQNQPSDQLSSHPSMLAEGWGDGCGKDKAPSASWTWAVLACVAFGVLVRTVRYALRFPLWGDEVALAANFLDRSYADLLHPLSHTQVAPPLFLWIELAAVQLFGFHEYSLRLFPWACGVGGLLVFWRLAHRLFPAQICAAAVAMLAVAHYPIRHSCEVKPYSCDLLAATLLTWIAACFWQSRRAIWLAAFGGCGALAVFLSFPSIFVAGGLSLAMAAVALREPGWRVRAAWVGANLVLASAFVCLMLWMRTIQHGDVGAIMRDYWGPAFPPAEWWLMPGWLLAVITGDALAYPIGGENGGSILTAVLVVVGCLACWKRGVKLPVVALLGVVFLAIIAAAMHKYPFGGHPRLLQYLAPLVCLVAGAGIWRLALASRSPARVVAAFLAVCGVLGTGYVVRDIARPCQMKSDIERRRLICEIWQATDAEVLCVHEDLQQSFGSAATAQVYRHIYVPRVDSPAERLARVGPNRALRCLVAERKPISPTDAAAFERWREGMAGDFDLRSDVSYDVIHGDQAEVFRVLEFSPRVPRDRMPREIAERVLGTIRK